MSEINTKICKIDDITLEQACTKTLALSKSNSAEIIVTPNIDHFARLVQLPSKDKLWHIYKQASLCLCDSKILQKLMAFKDYDITHVIPGSTLTSELFEHHLSGEDNIVIIGGDLITIEKLRTKYSHLTLNHYNPPMGFINDEQEVIKVLEFIKTAQPNFTFLAVGSPRQEYVAQKLKEASVCTGSILCIGASILFLVGSEKRAPILVQKMHLEWLYRLLQNPRRLFKRYFLNFTMLRRIYLNI